MSIELDVSILEYKLYEYNEMDFAEQRYAVHYLLANLNGQTK